MEVQSQRLECDLTTSFNDGNGQRGMAGGHLYAHFFEAGHGGLSDLAVKIIDKTDFSKPVEREGFLGVYIEYIRSVWFKCKGMFLIIILN